MRKLILSIMCIVLLFPFVACSKIEKRNPDYIQNGYDNDYPVIINDVTFTSAPKKVVSLSPAVTEIMFELGFEDKLVGRSDYCTYSEKTSEITPVGSPAKPDIDAILELTPDTVITQSPIATVDKATLEKKGIKVLVLSSPKDFFGLIDIYGALSKVFLGNIQSDVKVEKTLEPLDSSLRKAQDLKLNKKFVYITTDQMTVATGDTFEGNILSVFGDNIAKDKQKYSMTAEEIVAAMPELIFISDKIDTSKLPESIIALMKADGVKIAIIDNTSFEKPSGRLKKVIDKIIEEVSEGTTQTTSESLTE